MGKLIFADTAATVHVLIAEPSVLADGTKFEPTESRVLYPGETLTLEQVPSYLKESVLKGKAPGLSLLTELQVKKQLRDAARARGESIESEELDSEESTE